MKLCGFAEADMASVLRKSKMVKQRGAVTHDISAVDELKEVIDNALEGFQLLISESFKPIKQEKDELFNPAAYRKKNREKMRVRDRPENMGKRHASLQ